MATLVDYFENKVQNAETAATKAGVQAGGAVGMARSQRDAAAAALEGARTVHLDTVAALVAARAGVGQDGTWPDSGAQGDALRKALTDERAAAVNLRTKAYAFAKAAAEVQLREGELQALTAREADARKAHRNAVTEHAEVTRWREVLGTAPLDDAGALADSVNDALAAAEVWLKGQLPLGLFDYGLAAGDRAVAISTRSAALVAKIEDVLDGDSPANEWRAFHQTRSASKTYALDAVGTVAGARAPLEEIPGGQPASDAQAAEIADPAKQTDRENALDKLKAIDTAWTALAEFEAKYEQLRTGKLADVAIATGDVDSEALNAADAGGPTRAELTTALGSAITAYDNNARNLVRDWMTAVPADVWTRLAWFHRAKTDLARIRATPDVLGHYDAAEAALVAALEAVDAEPSIAARLSAGAEAAQVADGAVRATEDARRTGMVRGEPDDDRS